MFSIRSFGLLFVFCCFFSCKNQEFKGEKVTEERSASFATYCNPLDLDYRFQLEEPSRREAADPTILWFKDRYYLFASKSGGFWHSKDLVDWVFEETRTIPVEDYAPTAIAIRDTLYFLASSHERNTIYKTSDPLEGEWEVARKDIEVPVWDPAFFLDDDERLYLYWGCSDKEPLLGVELDYRKNFNFLGTPTVLKHAEPERFGWEVPGDYNTLTGQAPWIEGAWMNKHNGKYYLQYSGPGTEFKSYSDGVYVSEGPLGPFVPQEHNPFAYKPEGFAAGAGHGSTFKDIYGNYWHIGTITISQKHMFERRLGLYPAFFDDSGVLYTNTSFGDYPKFIPRSRIDNFQDTFPDWMLLSYKKPVEVSSSIDSLAPENMNDEDIRTLWAAKSGAVNEFAMIDLEEVGAVAAIQLNFAEFQTNLFGRTPGNKFRYRISGSVDKKNWTLLVDRSQNDSDRTHNYHPLDSLGGYRFIRVENLEVPSGSFAISGFRIFGKGSGAKPDATLGLAVIRNTADRRSCRLSWDKVTGATGYEVHYGSAPDKLYQSYMVYQDTTLEIHSLSSDQHYYFSIDSFNENGVSSGQELVTLE
ncbi:family 43 glycosylhydrolase [Robertkochia solimangrovi]|uniref:family 43 glycosylhydrolase n=1 Tax=Robertkochia solimangrovi TaxID=2213046 RepID=UPI00117F3E58|nr:family 43 glycosylhydrolase [Robertkochia solimangrovi]TRZ41274.1 carbohydrate-binding protein [Robertkochia solimangrovi]